MATKEAVLNKAKDSNQPQESKAPAESSAGAASTPQDVLDRMGKMEKVIESLVEANDKKDAENATLKSKLTKLETVVEKASERLEIKKPGRGRAVIAAKYKQFSLEVKDLAGKVIGTQRYEFTAAAIKNNKIYNPLAPSNQAPFITIDEAVENAQAGDPAILKAIIEKTVTGNTPDFSRAAFKPVGELQPVE